MTTPSPSDRRDAIAGLIFLLFMLGALVWACWTLATTHFPIAPWGAVAAIAGLPVLRFVVKGWAWIPAFVVAIVVVNLLGSDSFVASWSAGIAAAYIGLLVACALLVAARARLRSRAQKFAAAPQRQILGLSGYAGAGKDTAATGLLEDGWAWGSFAAKLKEFSYVIDVYDCYGRRVRDMVDAYGWDELKNCDDWYRAFLQRVGTDGGRDVLGPDVWVDAAMRDLPDGNVVFTDTRFPNEAAAIRAAGGHVIRITRPGVSAVNAHVSEKALDGTHFDAVIYNDTDPATAQNRLRKAAHMLAVRAARRECHKTVR